MVVIALIILVLIIALAKPRSKTVSSPPKKEYKTCPVCGKILLSETAYCPECGLDVRPLSSYIHPNSPKHLKFCSLFAIISLCVSITCLPFVFELFSYSEYNIISVGILVFVFLCSLILSIALFSYTIETQKKVDNEYADACKAEETRRIEEARRTLNDRREQERLEAEKAKRRLEEEARKAAEEKRKLEEKARINAEEERKRIEEEMRLAAQKIVEEEKRKEDLIKEHTRKVRLQYKYVCTLHDTLPRFSVDIKQSPLSIIHSQSDINISSFHRDASFSDFADFVTVDVETSGLFPPPHGNDGIAQISAVRFVNSIPKSVFITKVNPGIPMNPAASAKNGLYDDMLCDAPRANQVMDSFVSFLQNSPVVGFSLDFDLRFLTSYGFRDPILNRKYYSIDNECHRYLDSDGKLETISNDMGFYGIFHRDAYDALAIGYLCCLCVRSKFELPESDFPGLYYNLDIS